jgi:aminomethyltransferase
MSNEHPSDTSTLQAGARQSPLHAWHVSHGAIFTEFAGWRMPLRYGSDLAEHAAVRSHAGIFDLSHMGEIEVRGLRAGEALDYGLVGDLSGLSEGGARYTMLCEASGGVLDDLVVYRRSRTRFLVVANAANTTTVLTELAERARGFAGVKVEDQSEAYGLVALQGPLSQAILQPVVSQGLEGLRPYRMVEDRVAGVSAIIARTGYTGEDGFELFVPANEMPVVIDQILDSGGSRLLPAGLAARDLLRLEAGLPLYGNELTREVTPFEAGAGRVVHFEKPGDFVGRSALEQRAAEGPRILLVGLLAEGRRAPRHGYRVLDRQSGESVGEVTSGALSPTLARPIAMAYVAREVLAGARALSVDVRGTAVPVERTELPFYRRSKGGLRDERRA